MVQTFLFKEPTFVSSHNLVAPAPTNSVGFPHRRWEIDSFGAPPSIIVISIWNDPPPTRGGHPDVLGVGRVGPCAQLRLAARAAFVHGEPAAFLGAQWVSG